MQLLVETGIEADLEHVTDIRKISSYGVMGSPALIINGKVKTVGSIPSKAKLEKLILEGHSEIDQAGLERAGEDV